MRIADILIGIVLLIFTAIYFYLSFYITESFASDILGAAFFPKVLSGALILLTLIMLMRAILRKETLGEIPEEDLPHKVSKKMLFGTIFILVVYIVLLPIIGFLILTPVFLGGIIWFFGYRNIGILVFTAIVLTGAFYGIFGLLLKVLLPEGILSG